MRREVGHQEELPEAVTRVNQASLLLLKMEEYSFFDTPPPCLGVLLERFK